MKISELPKDKAEKLLKAQKALHVTMREDNSYHVVRVNKEGTRYFEAHRVSMSYSPNMPFGGGSYWRIRYGAMGWCRRKDMVGNDYHCIWFKTSQTFSKSRTCIDIPATLNTKKEVMALLKQIGMFND